MWSFSFVVCCSVFTVLCLMKCARGLGFSVWCWRCFGLADTSCELCPSWAPPSDNFALDLGVDLVLAVGVARACAFHVDCRENQHYFILSNLNRIA
jgi:hypothetical protein